MDKDPLHSDQILSTHTIHPPGIDVLDELGVGSAVRQEAPPSRTIRLAKGNAALDMTYANGRAEYCPRRRAWTTSCRTPQSVLARYCGIRTRVNEVEFEEGRAVGLSLTQGGRELKVEARLVVGADGRASTVAKQVAAAEYLGYDSPRAKYWGYWDAPPIWSDSSSYPFDMYIGNRAGVVRVIFQTDGGQLLLGSFPPADEAQSWKNDAASWLRRDLEADPVTGPLAREGALDGTVRGVVKERYFFRESAGPGWVLAGDAGHHKEFVIGDGITEALLQASNLAKAVLAGTDEALTQWWRARDVEAINLFFFGQGEGALGAPPQMQAMVVGEVARRPDIKARMAQVTEHRLSPYEAVNLLPSSLSD